VLGLVLGQGLELRLGLGSKLQLGLGLLWAELTVNLLSKSNTTNFRLGPPKDVSQIVLQIAMCHREIIQLFSAKSN